MAIVNQNFRHALANISKNVMNTSGTRIFVYSNAIAKPTNIQSTAFTLAPYSSALLLTFICTTTTFLSNSSGTVLFNTPPAAATATGTGTASWAALSHEAAPGANTNVIIGDVTLQTGDGMFYLPTLSIVSGTSYSILECSWTFS